MIDPTHLPEVERDAAWQLSLAVNGLTKYVDAFEAALNLFDACIPWTTERPDLQRRFTAWQLLAARDGAMSLYHYSKILMGSHFKNCPSLRAYVDHRSIRKSRQVFNSAFPHIGDIRHSIAHAAELRETREKIATHSFSGDATSIGISDDVQGLTISNSVFERRFTTTFEKKILQYEISGETLSSLRTITTLFISAFDKINIARIHQSLMGP
jgi:hypothetical protein